MTNLTDSSAPQDSSTATVRPRRSRLTRALRRDARVMVVAVTVAALVAAAPSVAATVVAYAKNAGAVNKIKAVKATASPSARKGKLVATGTNGLLPAGIIGKVALATNADTAGNATKLGGAAASAYVKPAHVVYVPAGGSGTANGTALTNALAAITTADASNPYVIQLEPGTYDLGTAALTMKGHVSIYGSSMENTEITSTGPLGEGTFTTIDTASNATLRDLTVSMEGGDTDSSTRSAITSTNTNVVLDHVHVVADGPVNTLGTAKHWGVSIFGAAVPIIRDSKIEAHNSQLNAPLYVGPGTTTAISVDRSKLISVGGGVVYDVVFTDTGATSVITLRDGSIVQSGSGSLANMLDTAKTVIVNEQLNFSGSAFTGIGAGTCLNSYTLAGGPVNSVCV